MKKRNGAKQSSTSAGSVGRPSRWEHVDTAGERVLFLSGGLWRSGVILRIDQAAGMAMVASDDGERVYRPLKVLYKPS